jgi:hypothetical protein
MAFAKWQAHVLDAAGNLQDAAAITVRRQSDNALASIFTDAAGTTPKANPFNTGSDGLAAFFAASDVYKVTATKGALTRTWEDISLGSAQALDEDDVQAIADGAAAGAVLTPVADDRLIANISGGSASPGAATLTAILDKIIGNSRGRLLYRSSSVWQGLAAGTAGQFLKTGGTGADPSWDTISVPIIRVVKTTAQSRTSSAAFVDDSELKFTMETGTYRVRAVYTISYGSGGFQIAVNGPSLTRLRATPFVAGLQTATTAYNAQIIGVTTAVPGPVIVMIELVIVVSAPGEFVMRIAQGASNGTASTFEAGSFLEYAKIA